MSFPNDYASDEWVPTPLTPSHPHPLRSHSTEDLHESNNTDVDSYFAIPVGTAPNRHHRRSRSVHSIDRHSISPFSTPSPGFTSASTERLCDPAIPGSAQDCKDFSVVPVRPPLRPTISFGGETRMSYYSITSLDTKLKAVAVKEDQQQRHEQKLKEAAVHTYRSYAVFTILCVFGLLNGMATTSLAAVLPAVAKDLESNAVQAFWTSSSFLLASALFQPLIMRLSHLTGSKLLLLLNIALFAAASIVCALATTTLSFTIGRTMQGCGSGAIMVLSQMIINQVMQLPSRRRCEETTATLFWFGAAMGPILAGTLTHTIGRPYGWRYSFWINVPCCFVSMALISFLLNLPTKSSARWSDFQRLDVLGWAIFTASLTLITISFSWAGSQHTWTSSQTLAPLIVGFVGLLFWWQYTRAISEPVLPMTIFRRATVVVSCFGTMVHGTILTAVIFILPLFFKVAKELNATYSGLGLGPWTFTVILASPLTGALIGRCGHRWAIWTGWGITTIGTGLMVIFKTDSPIWIYVPVGVVAGMGLGVLSPALNAAIQSAATTDDETIHAAPLHTFFSTLGQALGVVLASCVFLNRLHANMDANPTLAGKAEESTIDAVKLINMIMHMTSHDPALKADMVAAYVNAIRPVWIFLCSIAGLAFILSIWFTEDAVLRRRTRFSGDREMIASV